MNPTPTELKPEPRSGLNGLKIAQSIVLCLILLVGGFIGGMLTERGVNGNANTSNFADLEAVHGVIETDYYYLPTDDDGRAQVDADMEAGAIEGALGTLGDVYTRYLDVDESDTAQEGLEGTYGGVGIDVVLEHDVAFVSSVVPDSPADNAGVVRGDVIEQINGARVQTTDTNEVVRMLRGEIGSSVSLTLIRPSTGDVISLELTLEEIVVPSVILTFIEDTEYAWIRITIFGDSTVADLDAAIAEIRARGSKGVILDLRGNGGGWVVAARQTLGRFMDPEIGPAMYEDSAGSEEMRAIPIETDEDVEPLDIPMVVLTDGGTASAAEIVAGSLRDYQRATLVGERTFGKGSVQRIYEFSDGATLRVTVAEWFTPSRGRIQSEGVRPDVEISVSNQVIDSDPILNAGIQVLNSQIGGVATPEATPGTGN